jgi:hypothetical protein
MKVQMHDIWQDGPVPKNHSPVCDYCRKLISEGISPKTRLEVYRGETLVFKPFTLAKAAKWAIQENETIGPRWRKYTPFPSNKQPRIGVR